MNSISQSEPMDQGEYDYEGTINPLENSLVLQKLFSYLGSKDLLRLSSVSQLWNLEARCVLRNQRKCVAVIKGVSPCLKAKELNDLLGSSTVIPFNGLDIFTICKHDCVDDVPPGKAEEIFGNLLKMPFKYLKFMGSEECLLGQLVRKLMARSSTLEQLEITEIPIKFRLEQEKNVQEQEKFQLPKLNTLLIPDTGSMGAEEERFWGDFLRSTCNRAPTLQVLKNTVNLHWIKYVPTDKLRIFKNIKLPRRWPQDEDVLMLMNRFSEQGPKMYTLEADCPQIPARGFRMDNYSTLLFDLLSRSCGSLREVILDGRTAFMLRKYVQRKKPLANVTTLGFRMPENEQSTIYRYLLRVPLREIFPGITAVTMKWVYYRGSTVDEDAELVRPVRFSWPAVTNVELEDFEALDQNVRELATLFPNLQSLSLCDSNMYNTGHSFRYLWHWLPSLEKLDMSIVLEIGTFATANFDAEFCGLYEDEAVVLREMDDQYLKTVNIVPPFPPIHYRQGLQSIELVLEELLSEEEREELGTPSKTIFLSKVTGLIALRRMPNLEFNAYSDDGIWEHLEHLKPFLNLIKKELF